MKNIQSNDLLQAIARWMVYEEGVLIGEFEGSIERIRSNTRYQMIVIGQDSATMKNYGYRISGLHLEQSKCDVEMDSVQIHIIRDNVVLLFVAKDGQTRTKMLGSIRDAVYSFQDRKQTFATEFAELLKGSDETDQELREELESRKIHEVKCFKDQVKKAVDKFKSENMRVVTIGEINRMFGVYKQEGDGLLGHNIMTDCFPISIMDLTDLKEFCESLKIELCQE